MGKTTSSTKKVYAVAAGKKVGIFKTWSECQAQVKGYSKACFKSFHSRDDAERFLKANQKLPPPSAPQAPKKTAGSSSQTIVQKATKQGGKHNPFGTSLTSQTIEISIMFDGGARGNPGIAGAGAEIVTRYLASGTTEKSNVVNRCKVHVRRFVGKHSTNNEAEYQGLLSGLDRAKADVQAFSACRGLKADAITASVKIQGDSNLIIQQLHQNFKCKSEKLKLLYDNAMSSIAAIRGMASATFQFEHVYRSQNSTADALANQAMDSQTSWSSYFDEQGDEVVGLPPKNRFQHTND